MSDEHTHAYCYEDPYHYVVERKKHMYFGPRGPLQNSFELPNSFSDVKKYARHGYTNFRFFQLPKEIPKHQITFRIFFIFFNLGIYLSPSLPYLLQGAPIGLPHLSQLNLDNGGADRAEDILAPSVGLRREVAASECLVH